MSNNYYQVLEINKSASIGEIKAAFRKKALQYHPDINKTEAAHETFILIYEAYEILSDPGKRKEYDKQFITRNEVHFNDRYEEWVNKAKERASYYSKMNSEEFKQTLRLLLKKSPDIILTFIIIIIGLFILSGVFIKSRITPGLIGIILVFGLPLVIVGMRDLWILLKIKI